MSTNRITKLLLTPSPSLVVIAAACGGEEDLSAWAAASGPADRAALHGRMRHAIDKSGLLI